MSTDPTTSRYYSPSGRFNPLAIVLTLLIGGVAGAVLGAAYGYLTQFNPLVYVNFLATLGFGVCLSLLAALGISAGKMRNPWLAALLGLVVGGFGLYASWVFWMHGASLRGSSGVGLVDLLDPFVLWAIIRDVAQQGAWSMFGVTPTGIVLWAIWGIEGAIIVGACAIGCGGTAAAPFCERCGCWAKGAYDDVMLAPPADVGDLKTTLEGGLDVLTTLEPSQGNPRLQVKLEVCPQCNEVGYLDVTLVNETGPNDDRKDETLVVGNLVLEGSDIDTAIALGERASAATLAPADGDVKEEAA